LTGATYSTAIYSTGLRRRVLLRHQRSAFIPANFKVDKTPQFNEIGFRKNQWNLLLSMSDYTTWGELLTRLCVYTDARWAQV